ncbi:MAG: decarboxylase [Deltaproteobacteria bacterium]|nr:decarboxylase [Deltaproteobacteria bacterium]
MYGWRAKIGRISPSPETVGAEEWRRSLPDGVCLVETRTLIHDVTVEGLSETVKQVERAALELASAEVDVILQAGTAIAFFAGFGHDQELSARINAATGIKATTSLTAVVEALRALKISRIAIATSYLADIDARLVDVLEKSGFKVAAIRGMGLKKSIDMGKVLPEETYRLAREVVRSAPEADGILISCGNLRTFEAIEPLETDTGLPVVTSNQAGLWQALRIVGISERLPSLGRLLREH